ncbi:Uncharacterised protein [Mycobacterium tuberculosis]|nr:Uncharacterised protein [Mycobacterium tuberculosis]
MLARRRSFCVVFGFASTAVYAISASTANTTGTKCGPPSGVTVASRATGDRPKLARGSNSPTRSA